jgi:hypothetical protein
MGFDPLQIGYLRYAQAAGLGVANLDAIAIVGDPLASVARPCVPHSNHAVQRHWDRLPGLSRAPEGVSAIPAPHARTSKAARK